MVLTRVSLWLGRMIPNSETGHSFRRASLALAIGSLLPAIAALLSWSLGAKEATALGSGYVPMAPSTAVAFILLGGSLFLHQRFPSSLAALMVCRIALLAVFALSVLILAQSPLGFELFLERWLVPHAERVGNIPVGRMSVVTAGAFLLLSLAVFLRMPPLSSRVWSTQLSSVLALLTLAASIAVLLGYAEGTPLLYGGTAVPMALLTAVAFGLLSLGIIAAGREAWPLSFLFRPAPGGTSSRRFRIAGGPLATYLFLFVSLGLTWFFYLRHEIRAAERSTGRELATVASLKAEAIAVRLHGMRARARVVFDNPAIQAHCDRFLSAPPGDQADPELASLLEAVQKLTGSRRVVLFDARFSPRMAVPAGGRVTDSEDNGSLTEAMRTREIRVTDLHLVPIGEQEEDPGLHLDICIPIGLERGPGGPVSGILLLQMDVEDLLIPLHQTWQAPGGTGETLLVRREGDDVVYLSGSADQGLRFNIDRNRELPAAIAVAGTDGAIDGKDHRGVEVRAAARRIPETLWYVVATTDRGEMNAPLRRQAWATALIFFALFLAAAFGSELLWRRNEAGWLTRQLTERKLADAALRAGEAKLKAIMDHSPALISIRDPQGNVILANRRFEVLPEEAARRIVDSDSATLSSAASVEVEETLRHRDGTLHTYLTLRFPVDGGDGRPFGICAISTDMTEYKLLEERLHQSQKMDAVGRLAGGIAHDFNNQLTVVQGYADMLAGGLEDPLLRSYVDGIRTSSRRAADLTRQLLAFARKGKFVSAPVDLHTVVADLVAILKHSIDKKIEIRQRLEAVPSTVLGDPTQLQNALLNLALNAQDAMPSGGELSFATSVVDVSQKAAGLEIEPGKYLLVSVADTGGGMTAETKKHLFEPFFTTKEPGKGTGLGLASVYGTVKSHQGAVSVYSEEGHGTTFRIYLPLLEAGTVVAAVQSSPAPSITGARILLVDDEEMVRKVVSAQLQHLGCHVTACGSGAEAIEFYRGSWQSVDLVILDMVMPKMGGRELFQALRGINPGIRALLSSGYSINGDAQGILDDGVMGFLEKPCQRGDLAAKIAEVLGRK